MSFIEVSKLIMSGERIFNIPLRVCFYARVSTDSDVQLNSLNNQLAYYENYIKTKCNWTYVDGYIDEGISGVRVKNRFGFKRMIEDAKSGKFDLIITKEVSRFARDLEDSIHYIRLLKESNVGVFFENQNLNTFDYNSELILNIMFNLAQDESRKLSSRVKFGHREAIKKGHVLGSSNIIGYKKDKCKLVIVEEEARMVRKIYELYSSGNYGFYKLSRKLGELGFYNKNGNFYDKDTLKRIIENPKYKGFYRGKTTEVVDYRTKKRVKVVDNEQVIYKCDDSIVPAIVSIEIWDKCNEILKSRTANYLNKNYFTGGLKYPFSSKIICSEHNTSFERSHGSRKKNRPIWCCGRYLKYRLSACISPIIAEVDLYNIISSIMGTILHNDDSIINDMIRLYECVNTFNHYDVEIKSIEQQIKFIEDKKSMALDLVFTGQLDKSDLSVQFKQYEKEISDLNRRRDDILGQIHILNQNRCNIETIIQSVRKEFYGGLLNDFIRTFVDKIIVSKVNGNRYDVHLDIHFNFLGTKCLDGTIKDEVLYMENVLYNSIENLRSDRTPNKFIYNVYLETL